MNVNHGRSKSIRIDGAHHYKKASSVPKTKFGESNPIKKSEETQKPNKNNGMKTLLSSLTMVTVGCAVICLCFPPAIIPISLFALLIGTFHVTGIFEKPSPNDKKLTPDELATDAKAYNERKRQERKEFWDNIKQKLGMSGDASKNPKSE